LMGWIGGRRRGMRGQRMKSTSRSMNARGGGNPGIVRRGGTCTWLRRSVFRATPLSEWLAIASFRCISSHVTRPGQFRSHQAFFQLVNVYSSSIHNQSSCSELRSTRLPPFAPALPSRAQSMRCAAEARNLSSHLSPPAAYITSFFSARYQGPDIAPTAEC
jgi:hypothetical protein